MLLPLSWLKEYVDVDITPQQLETKLFSIGFEVEELKYLGAEISNCVVGQIINITKHPDSDHLQICKLNCGRFGEEIQIVTGAQNVFVGAKVPVALNGSTLVGGVKIKKGKLRGVDSEGMLCSGGELGIGEDFFPNAGVDGILILPQDTEIAEDIKKIVGLDDWVYDISITANRPDAESIVGLAREVAVILQKPFKMPNCNFIAKENAKFSLDVAVEDKLNCPFYSAQIVDNIILKPSPLEMRQRLVKCGINPINNIVDITNYVLLELGQPMHAFDYRKIEGQKLVVRRAEDGETLKTLDEEVSTLTSKNLVVADNRSPLALAGIMGGLESGVQEDTTTIVFESAVFMRESVRKTSRALGISSDSSHRFEKGLNIPTTKFALNRALHLIEKLNCGEIINIHKEVFAKEENVQILKASYDKINAILGITVPKDVVKDILSCLEFKILSEEGDSFEVQVPNYRTDVEGVPDLAEEVIRIYGYNHITPRLLESTHITNGGYSPFQKNKIKTKNLFAGMGFNEIVTYSFYGKKDLDLFKIPESAEERKYIKLQNPLTEDIEIMRTILAPSTVNIINKNLKKGVASGRFFELANIYIPHELPIVNLPTENLKLSLGLFGDKENFFTLKGALENLAGYYHTSFKFEPTQKPFLHPYRSAKIIFNGEEIGFMGQLAYEITNDLSLDTDIFVAELDYDKFFAGIKEKFEYKNVTKYPEIKRDLAVLVKEEVTAGQVEEVMMQSSKKLSEVKLFDVYRGEKLPEGAKSMAFTLTFTPAETPITHEEVDAQIGKILNRLNSALGAILRE